MTVTLPCWNPDTLALRPVLLFVNVASSDLPPLHSPSGCDIAKEQAKGS